MCIILQNCCSCFYLQFSHHISVKMWQLAQSSPKAFSIACLMMDSKPSLLTKLLITSPGVNGAQPGLQDQQADFELNSRLGYVSSQSCSHRWSPRPHHQETPVQKDHLKQGERPLRSCTRVCFFQVEWALTLKDLLHLNRSVLQAGAYTPLQAETQVSALFLQTHTHNLTCKRRVWKKTQSLCFTINALSFVLKTKKNLTSDLFRWPESALDHYYLSLRRSWRHYWLLPSSGPQHPDSESWLSSGPWGPPSGRSCIVRCRWWTG